MSKTSVDKLLLGVIDGIFTYFRAGKINSKILAKCLINPELENINDFERLLRIHFILQDEVFEFITELNESIRKIKKRTKSNLILKRGQIKGRIIWQRTILLRYSKYFQDNSIFVCNDPLINFSIPGNLILKEIISVLYSILKDDLGEFEAGNYKYDWFHHWKNQKKTITTFFNFYQKNIYLKKIKTKKNQKIPLREIRKVLCSRNNLYRKAANLLLKYYKIKFKQYDKDFVKKLLKSTLIVPKEPATIFELYCIFKIISRIQKKISIKLNLITKLQKELAIFENNNWLIKIFHNSTGSFNFFEKIEDINENYIAEYPYIQRLILSRKLYYQVFKEISLKEPKKSLYSGRPDIIIECWRKHLLNKKELVLLCIGEIKFTLRKYYFSKGLKELMEYLYYAKFKSKYLLESNQQHEEISKDLKIYGILIADKTNFLKKHKFDIKTIKIDIFNSNSINDFDFDLPNKNT